MKESAGQSGVVENLAGPDDAGVFASAVVKFDNGASQMVPFGKLEAEAKPAPATDYAKLASYARRLLDGLKNPKSLTGNELVS